MSSVSNSTSSDLQYYNKLFRDLSDDVEEQRKSSAEKDAERARRIEEAYQTDLKRQQEQTEEAVRQVRDNSNDVLSSAREYHKSELQELKENYDRLGRTSKNSDSERQVWEKRLADAHASSDLRARMADDKVATAQRGLHDTLEDVQKDALLQAETLRASHRDETGEIAQKMKELSAVASRLEDEKAEALARDVREHENEWLLKERRLISESGRELDNLRAKGHDLERYYGNRNAETARQKDAYFAEIIRKQNQDAHREQKRVSDQFSTQIAELEKQRSLENRAAELSSTARLASAHEQESKALTNQAHAYQDLMERQQQSSRSEVDMLQKTLQEAKTSKDTQLISPAAEASVRKTLLREYEKQFDAEKARNKASVDALQKSHVEKTQDLLWHEENKLTTAVRTAEAEKTQDRSMMNNFTHELEHDKASALRFKDFENEKATGTMSRNYGLSLERQRRSYEAMLETARSDMMSKIQNIRQEGDFRLRLNQREAQQRQAETVRDYEKKMAEQRADFELKIEELKTQRNTELRESEKRGKMGLEEQQRQYEQRIAQMEAQHNERTRYMEASFRDEMDRVRRSNEQLLKKKG